MGSAVSAVSSIGSQVINGLSGIVSGSGLPGTSLGLQGLLNPLAQGSADLTSMVDSVIPQVPIADQTQLQNQINSSSNMAQTALSNASSQQGQANQNLGLAQNQILGNSQNAINQGQGAIQNAQGAVNNAQQVNQGVNSNVNNSIDLVGQTAAGGGAAQQAANATLQQGSDKAIQQQQSMANSGNLSQMIGGQRNAMTNAANIQEQNALNASLLQANLASTAQGQYTGAAAQQAGQAAQNASLQQQAGLQQNQATQLTNIGAAQTGAAQGYTGAANAAQGNAITGQTGALGIQQQALGQTAQYRAQALGGLMNAGGGIAGASLASDKNLKTDIKSADIKSFLDALDPVSFQYKDSDGQNGKTQGTHLGILAQQVEKAPNGQSMVQTTAQGKSIDVPSAVGTLMAAAADANQRMSDLEKLFKSRQKADTSRKDKK